jgi:hypothetical protein
MVDLCSSLSRVQGERNYIMQVICEATQNPSIDVQVGAFECLVRIMGLYYDKMAFYMEQALFGVRLQFYFNASSTLTSTKADGGRHEAC